MKIFAVPFVGIAVLCFVIVSGLVAVRVSYPVTGSEEMLLQEDAADKALALEKVHKEESQIFDLKSKADEELARQIQYRSLAAKERRQLIALRAKVEQEEKLAKDDEVKSSSFADQSSNMQTTSSQDKARAAVWEEQNSLQHQLARRDGNALRQFAQHGTLPAWAMAKYDAGHAHADSESTRAVAQQSVEIKRRLGKLREAEERLKRETKRLKEKLSKTMGEVNMDKKKLGV